MGASLRVGCIILVSFCEKESLSMVFTRTRASSPLGCHFRTSV